MKVVLIGCVDFSESAFRCLLEQPDADIVGVVTRTSSSTNADFRSLSPLAETHRIPCLAVETGDQGPMAAWIRDRSPDAVLCFGWSRLLGGDLLSIPRLGTIGYHPALLPRHRGRHPIIWALALGLTETGSTFFFMDEGPDSGDVLDQERVTIDDTDNAATLYAKLTIVAGEQIARFIPLLAGNRAPRRPQDPRLATYWRKRGKRDGQIDWRMPATGIHNLVRALTRPYPGAHAVIGDRDVPVWRTHLSAGRVDGVEPGKVLEVDGRTVTVQCGVGAITLVEHGFERLPSKGDYL